MCTEQGSGIRNQESLHYCINGTVLRLSSQRGVSLVELIMFIVIVSIGLAGIMLVINQTTGHSADTLLRKQAQAAAESLLEEIESHAVSGVIVANTQANRPNFTSVFNYDGFATSGILPADGTATPVSGLSNYNVVVAVSSVALGNIPVATPANVAQITVTVTDPVGNITTATGYRAAY